MKKVLLVAALVAVGFGAKAQTLPVDPATKLITYSEVIQVENVSKDDLFTRASEWFAKTYRSSNAVLQMNDRQSGQLVGKPLMTAFVKYLGKDYEIGNVHYTITVACKDGRYKYEVTNLYHDAGVMQTSSVGPLEKEKTGVMSPSNKQWQQIKTNADTYAKALVEDLKKAMSVQLAKSEW